MTEQIKFDEKYLPKVINYLDSHKELHNGASFYGDGKLYMTNSRKMISGITLQKCHREKNKMVLSLMNFHPCFSKIKIDLEEIIKEK
jgi:hypothetical protein